MKDMFRIRSLAKENHMKKLIVVAAMAAVMVVAFAAPAFAAIQPAYIGWSAAGANALVPSPHNGYTQTTEKCAVCHSVHNAPAAGATVTTGTVQFTAGSNPQMLLRSSVAESCRYCHIDTAIGGTVVYGGTATYDAFIGGANPEFGHNTACSNCHAVHGANTIQGAVAASTLRNWDANNRKFQDEFVESLGGPVSAKDPANQAAVNTFVGTLPRATQVSVFCTRCHDNWSDASERTVTAEGYRVAGFYDNVTANDAYGIAETQVKHHPLVSTINAFAAGGATTGATQVAWKTSAQCASCHDAGDGSVSNNFPHYTAGAAEFLLSADDAGATGVGAASGSQDGVCIKCHVSGTGAGVGVNF
jgi:cytochrome c553